MDHRADLYSLGVIFYEMLTGELPLGHFPLPSQKAHTDARLDKVVMRALEKEPDRRFQQASEILTQVETFSVPATAAAVRSRKMAVVYGIGLACALVLVAVMGYALFHRGPNSGNAPGNAARAGGRGGGRGGRGGYFTNTLEGPSLRATTVTNLQLTPEEVQVANAILHTISQDFSQIQSNYVSHDKDAAGHVHITVKPLTEADAARVKALRERMWKELGGVLSPAQLERARNLPARPFEGLLPLNTNVTENSELWKDSGGEYHYIDATDLGSGGDTNRVTSTNITIIPARYRNLLEGN